MIGRQFGAFGLAALLSAASLFAQTTNPSQAWINTWGCAPQLTEPNNMPPAPGLSGNTLRQVVHVILGGKQLRVNFSNLFGNAPLTMNSVYLARSVNGDATMQGTGKPLSFHGQPSVTIPVGESLTSDVLDYDLPPMTHIAITIAFGSVPSALTGHPGSRSTSFLDPTVKPVVASMPDAQKTVHWYVITGIEVPAPPMSAAVMVLGDSITDGRGSTPDGNNRWTDNLARRLHDNAGTEAVTVVNEGLGGNSILTGGLGPTALSRFDRDIINQPLARWAIVLEGVNDIGGSRGDPEKLAADLIAAYITFIEKAHAHNMKIYGVPILPFGHSMYSSPAHEQVRQTVNAWMRNSGKFDAVIDMDAAVRDPADPASLQAIYDTGDHLHPNVAGYQKMAEVVDLKLFVP